MTSRSVRETFRFRFGQRVRIKPPHPESGASGRIINGSLYLDGRELYAVDVPGGAWIYDSAVLEDASSPSRGPPKR
jgi:hypothetical protein